MQLLIKNFFNYLKIAGINLLILLIIIIIIELIFGHWFKKDNWGNQIRSFRYKNVEFTSEFTVCVICPLLVFPYVFLAEIVPKQNRDFLT